MPALDALQSNLHEKSSIKPRFVQPKIVSFKIKNM